jgi:hypothetical protein
MQIVTNKSGEEILKPPSLKCSIPQGEANICIGIKLCCYIIRNYVNSLRHKLKISNKPRVCVHFLHVASSQQLNYTLHTELAVTFTVRTLKEFHVVR